MELNVSLIEQAIERVITERRNEHDRLLAVFPNVSFWEDVPKHRASLDHLFSTLLVVVGKEFGDFRIRIPWTPPHTISDNYWKIYRFGFSNGFIPVFSAPGAVAAASAGRYDEFVVVPSETDGVLMAAFVDQLDWPTPVGAVRPVYRR